ncbi:hypothetical protein VTL71DRAFT_11654 [Oculimacula yallundae]|uniref:Uncharacterized protein n=1 Tax=Oculimacula yallundae TaxID=86028 RepID=A0ABR4CQS6_9HELO
MPVASLKDVVLRTTRELNWMESRGIFQRVALELCLEL